MLDEAKYTNYDITSFFDLTETVYDKNWKKILCLSWMYRKVLNLCRTSMWQVQKEEKNYAN